MTVALIYIIGVFGMTAFSGYWCWCGIRVWLLRQRLFLIRNSMFDVAANQDALQHPHYIEARESMNRMIRIAPLLSYPVLKRIVNSSRNVPTRQGAQLDFVNDHLVRFSREVVHMATFWTFSGWMDIAMKITYFIPKRRLQETLKAEAKFVRRAMRSPTMAATDGIPEKLYVC